MNDLSDEAAVIRDWLNAVMRETGMKPTPLAKAAGLAPSTLLRALDPDNPTALERRSISKIVDRLGVAGPYLAGAPNARPTGMAESELLPLDVAGPAFAGEALSDNQFVRRVNTRALDLAGLTPGDEVLLDMAETPAAGDIVAAQVYNLQRGTADTVIRLYDPPYLVTRSTDASAQTKPLPVDDERVKIMAVVVKALWVRGR